MVSAPRERFTLIDLPAEMRRNRFARDVAAGLTASPRWLPYCYFYDRLGSRLFEAICELPEYYLTRAETAILKSHARDIAAHFPSPTDLIELGSGTATKTRLLIEAFLQRHGPLRYVPLDICRSVLEESSPDLLRTYADLEVLAIAGEYHDGLAHLGAVTGRQRLVCWLGSNIGNLHRAEAAEFLGQVGATLSLDDRLLVGIDLRKAPATLEAAYNDACGVTAAFNRNLLVRLNRELRGSFDVKSFAHQALYDEIAGRVEMHLVSARAQRVRIADLDLDVPFAAGETIHTENSYKYSPAEIDALAAAAELRLEQSWLDPERLFRLTLFARR
jgi:dimethylhistidine N-methyltransferase